MLTTKEFQDEAEAYQKVSVIRDEVKVVIVEAFADVMCHDNHRTFFLYTEALYDLTQSVVSENYKGVIFSVNVTVNQEDLEVTLNFVYEYCVREFKLTEYDFKSYKEERDEEENRNENE